MKGKQGKEDACRKAHTDSRLQSIQCHTPFPCRLISFFPSSTRSSSRILRISTEIDFVLPADLSCLIHPSISVIQFRPRARERLRFALGASMGFRRSRTYSRRSTYEQPSSATSFTHQHGLTTTRGREVRGGTYVMYKNPSSSLCSS